MKTVSSKKLLSFILCFVLIAAMALFAAGCNDSETPPASTPTTAEKPENITVLGEGATTFYFNVVNKAGKVAHFEIHTDKAIVGEALQELKLIEGEQGDYGLYVKSVNGETLDYATDGMYWSFYLNGEYALTGVDQTDITPGETYEFRAEAA